MFAQYVYNSRLLKVRLATTRKKWKFMLKLYFHKFTVYIEMKRWYHNDYYKLTPKTCAFSRLARYELEDESHRERLICSWIVNTHADSHTRAVGRAGMGWDFVQCTCASVYSSEPSWYCKWRTEDSTEVSDTCPYVERTKDYLWLIWPEIIRTAHSRPKIRREIR